jgi:cytochrome c oxidase cbb3-type subunit 1
VVQRTCQVPLFMPKLAPSTSGTWQAVIVAAAISLPLGYTQGKEYAELEWPIDILITLGLGRLRGRVLRHRRHAARCATSTWPTGSTARSSSRWRAAHRQQRADPGRLDEVRTRPTAGVQDAMVQWWYGHNAVGFFLTAGFLG